MFGARDLDSSRRHEGLVATIAFESLVKLLAFLAVGAFVTYGAFGGLREIVEGVARRPEHARMLGGDPDFSYGDWTALTWLAARYSKLLVGGMVMCNNYRHPAVMANMGKTLQAFSGGRMVLGYGAGWREDEYKRFGFAFDPPAARIKQLQVRTR